MFKTTRFLCTKSIDFEISKIRPFKQIFPKQFKKKGKHFFFVIAILGNHSLLIIKSINYRNMY